MTPSQAKNAISKALLEVVDPAPSDHQKAAIRSYFDNSCAYCAQSIAPDDRKGHLDHLISRQNGGSNHPSNLVLACNKCNGDEKLDQDWREFIKRKVSDDAIRASRIMKIEAWVGNNGGPVVLSAECREWVASASRSVKAALDCEIRCLKDKRRTMPSTVVSTRGTPAAYAPGAPGFRPGHG